MIITCKKRIPNLWIFIAILPWSAVMFKWLAMGMAFTFSIKKFIDNPAGLTFVMSLPAVISLVLGPFCNFMSDRIWTRFGRRKPFIVASWIGTITFITLMPLMPNFWMLLAVFLLFSAFNDIGGGPMEILKQEIVPPKQRGLSAAAATWMSNFANLVFMFVAIGRFDDYKFMAGLPVTGEQSIYWSLAAAMTIMLMVIMFGIKELDPKSSIRGQKFSLRNFFGGILNRNLWPVYVLIFGYAMMTSGLGVMGVLLYTEQWQFTKQEMGINIAVGGVMNMFFITILGIFANKLPRMKTYQILMGLFIIVNICFYLYVNHVLYDRRPTLVELIVFGETMSVIGLLVAMVYPPLVYDYVPRNEMGTYAAGSGILNKIVAVLTLNGVGLFVWAYSALLLPPGGEMTRVALQRDTNVAEVRSQLAPLTRPDTGAPAKGELSVEPWYATGAALDHGRAFEIRLKNPDSVSLKKQRDALDEKRTKLTAQEKNALALAEDAAKKGQKSTQTRQLGIATQRQAEIRTLSAQIDGIDRDLQTRADKFRGTVGGMLDGVMVKDGDGIRSAAMVPGIMVDFPLTRRPQTTDLEKTLDRLRLKHAEVADLRAFKRGDRFYAALSAELPAGLSADALAATLVEAVKREKMEHVDDSQTPAHRGIDLLAMELDIVEDPLDRHISPISRVVNAVLANFTDVAPPEKRVFGLARGMRGIFDHVSVRQASPEGFAIRVLALPPEQATPPLAESPVSRRLNELLPSADAARAADFTALYDRTVEISPQQRITVIRPVLTSSFATLRYDYMSGYLWMLGLGVIGLGITFAFSRREAKGLIHKRGLEESEATEDAGMDAGERMSGEVYVPGHLLPKLCIVALGIVMVGFASLNLVPALKLLLTGERAQAEATVVYKEKLGGEMVKLSTDAEILTAHEARDRSFVFWNEYRYRTTDGREITFRATAGSQLKPAHALFDDNGLPTTLTVYYNPAKPEKIVLPTEFSTWFMPGTLALFGLAGALVGIVLAWNARKPIPLPHIAES